MANNIALFTEFVPMLDEVYKGVCKTSVLDGNPELVHAGANANELVIPKMNMDGLADYSRNSGYVGGEVSLVNETVVCNFDRGRMFVVDNMDNAETAGVAFGLLAGEFIRTKVAPELDAFRFAQYAGCADVGEGEGTLEDGAAVVAALREAVNEMDENEVNAEERILFITPTLLGKVEDLDTVKSREVLRGFSQIVTVPQSRFYTGVKLKSGTGDEAAGGFEKAEDGSEINFMVVEKGAVIQFSKHVAPKVVTPEQNPDADAWKFGYRQVGIAQVYENKTAGIYVHHKA
ncbi:MAG: hypothetical protein E7331_04165 [Clostridiales bacterium]|nr:hypothetical protein [Clostridiales bacterium]